MQLRTNKVVYSIAMGSCGGAGNEGSELLQITIIVDGCQSSWRSSWITWGSADEIDSIYNYNKIPNLPDPPICLKQAEVNSFVSMTFRLL